MIDIQHGFDIFWDEIAAALNSNFNEVSGRIDDITLPLSVANLSALSALSSDYPAVYVLGRTTANDGGQGHAWWNSSDLSTEVTADTEQTIYIAPASDPTGASGAWIMDTLSFNVGRAGVGVSVANNYTALQTAIDTLERLGGGELKFPNGCGVYYVTLSSVPIAIPSNVIINLNGATIYRQDSGNFATFRNKNSGADTDHDLGIINGKVVGVGEDGVTTDQGSAITFFGVTRYRIENVRTDNTTGDGILLRRAYNGVLRDIIIGDYGRNGFSPDSGSAVIDNLIVEGSPFTGANPGLPIDVETDLADEPGDWTWNNVRAGKILLIDQNSIADAKFNIKAKFTNCVFGPDDYPVYIKSTNPTIGAEIVLDDTNTIIVDDTANGVGIVNWNVSGVTLNAARIKHADGITPGVLSIGIQCIGVVENFTANYPNIDSTFLYSIMAYSTNRVNDSFFKLHDLHNVYFGGSNNIIVADKAGTITIDGADSLANTIDIAEAFTRAIGLSGTASWNNQHVGSARGSLSKSFYSQEYSVPSGASHDLLVPLPAAGVGRAVLVSAAFSSAGLATEWGNVLQLVVYGASAHSARTAINSAGVGVTVSIVSVTATYMIVRVAHANAGFLTVTLIG